MIRYYTIMMAASFLTAAAFSAEPYNRESSGEKPEDFERNLKPLIAGISKAKSVWLYEGLPHQYWQEELLQQ